MVFTLLENALNLAISSHALIPLPNKNLPPNSCNHTLGRGKLLILPGNVFSKTCFPKHQGVVEETAICFIKIQSENLKMTWNIRSFIFCMICIFLLCVSFTVL